MRYDNIIIIITINYCGMRFGNIIVVYNTWQRQKNMHTMIWAGIWGGGGGGGHNYYTIGYLAGIVRIHIDYMYT